MQSTCSVKEEKTRDMSSRHPAQTMFPHMIVPRESGDVGTGSSMEGKSESNIVDCHGEPAVTGPRTGESNDRQSIVGASANRDTARSVELLQFVRRLVRARNSLRRTTHARAVRVKSPTPHAHLFTVATPHGSSLQRRLASPLARQRAVRR